MNTDNRIVIGDDLDSDALVAEIWFDSVEFAELFEPPPYVVHIYPHPNEGTWKVSIDVLQKAIAAAKERLDDFQVRYSDVRERLRRLLERNKASIPGELYDEVVRLIEREDNSDAAETICLALVEGDASTFEDDEDHIWLCEQYGIEL